MLAVGAASVDITPPPGSQLGGYAARTEAATGAHDPLLAQAIVVTDGERTSVVVVCDLVGLEVNDAAEARARVAAAIGVGAGDVVVAVTHTHSGPAVVAGMAASGVTDRTYLERVFTAVTTAARDASDRRRPAVLQTGRRELTSVAHNRRGETTIDPLVLAARWADADGSTIAVVFSHACHPVVLGPDNLLFTADWPGAARRVLQDHFGGEAIFVQGCCGQINTGHSPEASFDVAASERRTFAEAARIGATVAGSVIEALRSPRTVGGVGVSVSSRRVALPLGAPPDARTLRAYEQEWSRELLTADEGRRALLQLWVRWARRWRDERHPPTQVSTRVSLHQWGDYRLIFLPGEPFVEFALELRRTLDEQDLLVAGYADGVPGYLALRECDAPQTGYELTESHRMYGLPAPFSSAAGRQLFQACLQLGRSQ